MKKNTILLFFFTLIIASVKVTATSCKNIQKQSDSVRYYLSKANFFLKERNEDSIAKYTKVVFKIVNTKNNYLEIINFSAKVGHFYEGFGYFEKSIDIYQKALSIAESYNDYVSISKVLVDASQAYRIFHDYQKAINYGKRANKILEKDTTQNLRAKADALGIIAAAFQEKGQPDSAVVYQKKILSFLPRLDSTDIKTTIVNIGYAYLELGELEKSRFYGERALALYRPIKSAYALAAIFTNLGMYGNRANKYKYAHRMLDSAMFYTEKSNYIETLFWIYDERAAIYKKQKKYTKAIENLELSIKIKDSVFKTQRAKTAQEMEAKYKTSKKQKEITRQKEQGKLTLFQVVFHNN